MEQGNAGNWPTTTIHHQPLPSSTATPSNLSPEYASYQPYDSHLAAPYGHLVYPPLQLSGTAPQHSMTALGNARPNGGAPKYSFPAYSRSVSPTLRQRLDAGTEYPPSLAPSQFPSPGSMPAVAGGSEGYPSPSAASGYMSDVSNTAWSKHEYSALEPGPYYPGIISSAPLAIPEAHHARTARAPKRQTRKLTTKEDANYQCEVPGCGKLFSRSYNYKAHMATHDENREYPFPCLLVDCGKKFVRKTDLQRHNQSVHAKERSHRCDFCQRMFARRDTLRRHMDDGCSRRFDIDTVDMEQTHQRTYENINKPGGPSVEYQQPSTMHHYPPPMDIPHHPSGSAYHGLPHIYPDR